MLFFKGKKDNLHYQLFIEPKGAQYSDKTGEFKDSQQGWKEEFLQKISDKYSDGNLLKDENDKYKLIGLPFFNKKAQN